MNKENLIQMVKDHNPYIGGRYISKAPKENFSFTRQQKNKLIDLLTEMDRYPSLSLGGMNTTEQLQTIIHILKHDSFYKVLPKVVAEYTPRDSKYYSDYATAYNKHLDNALQLYTEHIGNTMNKESVENHINAHKGLFIKPLTIKEIDISLQEILKDDLIEGGFKETPAQQLSKELKKIILPR